MLGGGVWLFQRSLVRGHKDAQAGRGFSFAVRTAAVERGELRPTLRLQGDVVAHKAATVRAEVAGVITSMPAREGQEVAQGDPILAIQDKDFMLEVQRRNALGSQAQSGVKRQETAVSQAKDLVERLEKLWDDKLVSEEELTQARLALRGAEAALAEARAQSGLRYVEILSARRDRERSRMVAPFAGRVAKRFAEVGDRVAVGSPVVELVGGKGVELHLYLPVSQVNRIQPDTTVRFRLARSDGPWHEATIARVLPVADLASRNQTVVAPLYSPPQGVTPGMAVEAEVAVGKIPRALLLSLDALTRQGNQWAVFVVEEGKARQVIVEILGESDDRVAVTGSLKEGDQVVVVGNETLFPNAPVRMVGGNQLARQEGGAKGVGKAPRP